MDTGCHFRQDDALVLPMQRSEENILMGKTKHADRKLNLT